MVSYNSLSNTLIKLNVKHNSIRSLVSHYNRDYLKERLFEIIPERKKAIEEFKNKYGDAVIDKVQIFQGMRGIKLLYHEGSLVDPIEVFVLLPKGVKFHNLNCEQIREKLTYSEIGKEPLPEAVFWFLVTGEIPTLEQVKWLSAEWERRSELPYYLINTVNTFPDNLHPMAQLSAAVVLLTRFSKFSIAHDTCVPKTELWKPMYEDCMNLIAKLPAIAGLIYRNSFHDGNKEKDWATNFANILNVSNDPKFVQYLRLFISIHSDHEGGNGSAHTAHLVGSTLSDAFYSFSAAMNALAGPLHGRANQDSVAFINKMLDSLGADLNETKMAEYLLKFKGIIPGFGHAVLRSTDPRYSIIKRFAEENLPESPMLNAIYKISSIAPKLLGSVSKVKNPMPNVDAISGTVFGEFNLKEIEFYTVIFGIARSLGISASLIWARALGFPLERPESLTFQSIQNIITNK